MENLLTLAMEKYLSGYIVFLIQGTVIMALAFMLFENTFLNLVTVTFTSLIVIEVFNVFTEINQITLPIFIA